MTAGSWASPGAAAMPRRWAQARHPFIYEINTWPWLTGLSEPGARAIDLSTVPDGQWDWIAEAGFDAVWLMGVWERSPAGVALALANPDLVGAFTAALPDWVPDDVVGSPYCIRGYDVDARLGGRAGLAAARSALAARGVALILDFVPNHVAPDHPWTTSHPDYFVHGSSEDVANEPDSFIDVGGTVLANGRDPYLPAWPDVVQLDVFSPALRDAAVDVLRDVAGQCDGVRCDMAMLVMNDVFSHTWGDRVGDPPAGDYWPTVIGAVHRTHPNFTFIAESYWDKERDLQQQGFQFCYDKRLYDSILTGDAAAVRAHLDADVAFQNGLVRFVENHDEPRAAALFDTPRAQAVALTTLTQAGARMVHHGQVEGHRTHLPVFLGRSPREDGDADVASFHRALLKLLRDSTFREGDWRPCDIPATDYSGHLVAWCWDGDQRWLIIVNLSADTASGRVTVPWDDAAGHTHRLADPLTGVSVIRSDDDVRGGLSVELGAWQWHFFVVERIEQKAGAWAEHRSGAVRRL